jgi:hypothetical protein
MTTFTTEDRVAATEVPRFKDIRVGEFNLRFWEKDGQWVCSMPEWLIEAFKKELEK